MDSSFMVRSGLVLDPWPIGFGLLAQSRPSSEFTPFFSFLFFFVLPVLTALFLLNVDLALKIIKEDLKLGPYDLSSDPVLSTGACPRQKRIIIYRECVLRTVWVVHVTQLLGSVLTRLPSRDLSEPVPSNARLRLPCNEATFDMAEQTFPGVCKERLSPFPGFVYLLSNSRATFTRSRSPRISYSCHKC